MAHITRAVPNILFNMNLPTYCWMITEVNYLFYFCLLLLGEWCWRPGQQPNTPGSTFFGTFDGRHMSNVVPYWRCGKLKQSGALQSTSKMMRTLMGTKFIYVWIETFFAIVKRVGGSPKQDLLRGFFEEKVHGGVSFSVSCDQVEQNLLIYMKWGCLRRAALSAVPAATPMMRTTA